MKRICNALLEIAEFDTTCEVSVFRHADSPTLYHVGLSAIMDKMVLRLSMNLGQPLEKYWKNSTKPTDMVLPNSLLIAPKETKAPPLAKARAVLVVRYDARNGNASQ